MRRISNVKYAKAMSLAEARALLTEGGAQARLMAGGTDLLVAMKEKNLNLSLVVDIKGIPELSGIEIEEGKGLTIGALTSVHELETAPALLEHYPHIAEAARCLGSLQVRLRATVGGNICNASPSAELAPGLLVMEPLFELSDGSNTRLVKGEEFFTAPGRTVLKAGELLTKIRADWLNQHTFAVYEKFGPRRAMDIAVVNAAALLELDGTTVKRARVVLGAVAPTPLRAKMAEKVLEGNELTDELLSEAAQVAASEDAKSISDLRASREYRETLVRTLTRRALKRAWAGVEEKRCKLG